jgi:hypothetical protein
LWQGAGLLAAVVVTLLVANQFLPPERSVGGDMLGHDFLAFYTAGTLAREGSADQLYNLEYSRKFQNQIANDFDLSIGSEFGPYWNPPFYALAFAPLSALPYSYALLTWIALNLLCAVVACVLLCRVVAGAAHPWPMYSSPTATVAPPWRVWLLVPLLIALSMPFIQALSHGQNSMMSLLLLTTSVLLWRKNRPVLAGIACGLLFYKPQLAAIVATALALTLGWRAVLGMLLAGVGLLAAQEYFAPGSTQLYLHQLPLNLAAFQIESSYLWERHVTLKAFWRLLFQGREPGALATTTLLAWVGSSVILAGGLISALRNTWRARIDDPFGGHTRRVQRDRFIAAVIVSMPLLMPFYFDYDLLLLAIPFTLLAAERLGSVDEVIHPHDRLLLWFSAGLYLWLMVNPGLARDGEVNMTVVALASVAGLFIGRACRERSSVQAVEAGDDASPAQERHLAPPRRLAA